MSRLQELINELCPNGVEYKTIGDISKTLKKETLKTNELIEGGKYPVINSGREIYGFYNNYNNDGDAVTIAARGEYAGVINYFSDKFWAGGLCYPYTSINENILNTKFLYYYLKSKEKNIMETLVTRGSIPALNKNDLDKYKIAVPPLEVQREIVHILDDFTLLSAELSAELKARQKQYEYYRDKIFSFNDYKNVEYKKLGDISTIKRGGNFQKKDFIENGYPCIHYGQIYTKYGLYTDKVFTYINEKIAKKSKIAKPNSVIMAVTSENIEDVCKCVAWVGNSDIAISGHTAIIESDVNAKYLSYYFHTSMFYIQKLKYVHGTKVIEVTPDKLNDIIVPVVPEEKQEEIVDKLDTLDKLCNDISLGLPSEIEARQKQYEYYRDKLLNFKELKIC